MSLAALGRDAKMGARLPTRAQAHGSARIRRLTLAPVTLLLSVAACAAAQRAPAVVTAAEAAAAPPPRFIAHAGGVADQRVYTNSLQALEASAAAGHELVELDFSWTADDELVLLHDWDVSAEELLGLGPEPATLAQFRAARPRWGLRHLALDDLSPWLHGHPGVDVVTDAKSRNVEALTVIAERLREHVDRFVPQIHWPAEYAPVRALGFERVMLTLYASQLADDEVVTFARDHELFGVAVPVARARSELPGRLAALGVPVWAHTVNDYALLDALAAHGVHGAYTDWLSNADRAAAEALGALPAWTVECVDPSPLDVHVAPFVPPAEVGFSARLGVTGAAPGARAEVTLRAADGAPLASRTLAPSDPPLDALADSRTGGPPTDEQTPLVATDVHTAFPDPDGAWLEIDATEGARLDAHWRDAAGTELPWVVSDEACARFVTRGPGGGLAGHLLAWVNPTDEPHRYRLRRRVGARLLDDLTMDVPPRGRALRIFDCRTDETIEVELTGGPLVVQTLRWDPLRRQYR